MLCLQSMLWNQKPFSKAIEYKYFERVFMKRKCQMFHIQFICLDIGKSTSLQELSQEKSKKEGIVKHAWEDKEGH